MLRPSHSLLTAFALMLAACTGQAAHDEPEPPVNSEREEGGRLGLFSTLPIYWGENGDIASILDGGDAQADDHGEAHAHDKRDGWVRAELEETFTLYPLDTLEADALEDLRFVLLAQPRPLAPSENVAFDTWLRKGGRALIFADPMLTQHSGFALGDPRRPHDMVVISPLLTHWGLVLEFDENQQSGLREMAGYPVELAGRFSASQGTADCVVEADGLIADCKIGEGRALLVADAALLDDHQDSADHRLMLDRLIERSSGN